MYKYIAGSYGLKLTKGVATSSLRYFAQNEKEMRACDVILQILILHSWLVNAATNQGSRCFKITEIRLTPTQISRNSNEDMFQFSS